MMVLGHERIAYQILLVRTGSKLGISGIPCTLNRAAMRNLHAERAVLRGGYTLVRHSRSDCRRSSMHDMQPAEKTAANVNARKTAIRTGNTIKKMCRR